MRAEVYAGWVGAGKVEGKGEGEASPQVRRYRGNGRDSVGRTAYFSSHDASACWVGLRVLHPIHGC